MDIKKYVTNYESFCNDTELSNKLCFKNPRAAKKFFINFINNMLEKHYTPIKKTKKGKKTLNIPYNKKGKM